VPVGMLLGAHYIHLIFYEQSGLFDFPRVDEDGNFVLGRFFSLGSGLASHGGGLGCVLAVWLFWRLYGQKLGISFFRYADAVMITSIFVYPFVRLGNFFNSEILGRRTDGPWAVIFARVDDIPRHPVVLYEAFFYFCELAFAVLWFQPRYVRKLRPGATFFLFLAIHFTLRFIAEFAKDAQHVDEGWALNMGHLLSLPIVLGCSYMILFTKRFNIRTPLTEAEKAYIEESARSAAAEEHRLDVEAAIKKGEPPPPPPAGVADDAPKAAAKGGAKKKPKKPGERRADA
jgi:phosphatidylglycerol---prolipoprotein diacylglyceryl transferase